MAGYSKQAQLELAILVRCHRRKLSDDLFSSLLPDKIPQIKRLAVLLRLAVVLHHARNVMLPDKLLLTVNEHNLRLRLGDQWADAPPAVGS
jgi:exopolyphosphatase/guanosine-5'-triphosphate,3'-diphosphate pyrophosphatase